MISPGTVGTSSSGGATIVVVGGNSTIGSGSKSVTTAGSRVQLSVASVPCKKLIIQSTFANTGNTYVGDVTVSSTVGLVMYPGAATSFTLTPNNLNLIYIDSAVSGEGVTYYYEQ